MSDLTSLHALAARLKGVTRNTFPESRCYKTDPKINSESDGYAVCNTVTQVTPDFIDSREKIAGNSAEGVSYQFDNIEFFEERAAILEYDSGLSRRDAERLARAETEEEAAKRSTRWKCPSDI